jgi:hypothetical protein
MVPFNTMATYLNGQIPEVTLELRKECTAMIMFPTAIAERACLHERPTANMELAICQVAAFAASEIQYAM